MAGDGRVNALRVRSFANPVKSKAASLWKQPDAAKFEKILFADLQCWVHVDYSGYREGYRKLAMPAFPAEYFLDHIQNRRAIRARDFSHPYLRLCPVTRQVNTSGGHGAGGEGMEVEFVKGMKSHPKEFQQRFAKSVQHPIVYADPMDLTKMLNKPPGTKTLVGVRDLQTLFFT